MTNDDALRLDFHLTSTAAQNSAAAPVSSALMHTAPPTRPSIAGNRPAQQMLSIGPLVDVVVPEDYISE